MNQDTLEAMFTEASQQLDYVTADEVTAPQLYERDNGKHSLQWWRRRLERMVRDGKATKRNACRRGDNRQIVAYKMLGE